MKITYMKTWVFSVVCIRFFIDGSEELFIAPSAWTYIKSLGESMTFLGLVLSAFPVGALLTGSLVGKLADRFGYIKFIIILSFTMKVIGNLIYSIPVSGYFPLFGRFLSGLADGSAGVFYGQIALSTPEGYTAQVFIIMDGAFILGTLFGPTVSVFLTFNINLLGWKIDAGNSPGIVLTLIWFVMLVIALWFPKEFGTTKVTLASGDAHGDSENNGDDNFYNGDQNSDEGDDVLAKKESCDPPTFGSRSTVSLVFYLVFLAFFYSTTVMFYVPLLALEHFHLQFIHVKLLFLVGSLFSIILFLLFYLAAKYYGEAHLLVCSILMQVAAILILTYFAFAWENVSGVYGGYFLIAYICLGMPYFSFSLGCSLLSKITDPRDAAFYQGSSFAALHSGLLISRVISSYIFTKTSLLWFCLALVLSWTLGVVWFALKYPNLKQPKEEKQAKEEK